MRDHQRDKYALGKLHKEKRPAEEGYSVFKHADDDVPVETKVFAGLHCKDDVFYIFSLELGTDE